jgi:hypothetical protein
MRAVAKTSHGVGLLCVFTCAIAVGNVRSDEALDRDRRMASKSAGALLTHRVMSSASGVSSLDSVIKEYIKVLCGSPNHIMNLHEMIDRSSLSSLLDLQSWRPTMEVTCGCFVESRSYLCGQLWLSPGIPR